MGIFPKAFRLLIFIFYCDGYFFIHVFMDADFFQSDTKRDSLFSYSCRQQFEWKFSNINILLRAMHSELCSLLFGTFYWFHSYSSFANSRVVLTIIVIIIIPSNAAVHAFSILPSSFYCWVTFAEPSYLIFKKEFSTGYGDWDICLGSRRRYPLSGLFDPRMSEITPACTGRWRATSGGHLVAALHRGYTHWSADNCNQVSFCCFLHYDGLFFPYYLPLPLSCFPLTTIFFKYTPSEILE